jgi:protein-S-isoprenylcysteine O-methyltransferase
MNISQILGYAVFLFPLSEMTLLIFKRTKKTSPVKEDRGSLQLLWFSILASLGIAIALQWYPLAVFQISRSSIDIMALCFLTVGFIVRWISIVSLGKMFTVNVAIQEEHHLLQTGLYKYVRHPSYSGMLFQFLGLAIYFGTWICLLVIMVPITSAVLYRIRCEERVLAKEFGKQYGEYKARTKSIIPRVI